MREPHDRGALEELGSWGGLALGRRMVAPDNKFVALLARTRRADRQPLAVGAIAEFVGAAALGARHHQVIDRVGGLAGETVVAHRYAADAVDHRKVLDLATFAALFAAARRPSIVDATDCLRDIDGNIGVRVAIQPRGLRPTLASIPLCLHGGSCRVGSGSLVDKDHPHSNEASHDHHSQSYDHSLGHVAPVIWVGHVDHLSERSVYYRLVAGYLSENVINYTIKL